MNKQATRRGQAKRRPQQRKGRTAVAAKGGRGNNRMTWLLVGAVLVVGVGLLFAVSSSHKNKVKNIKDRQPAPAALVSKVTGVSKDTINAVGHLTQRATGLEQVLGLAFRGHSLYALEMSTTPGGPTPGSGAIVQVGPSGPVKTVVSGLIFPTGMTVGKDGAFYVSEQGFGFGAGDGRILRITTH